MNFEIIFNPVLKTAMIVTYLLYAACKNRSILPCIGHARIICAMNTTGVLQSAATVLETLPWE